MGKQMWYIHTMEYYLVIRKNTDTCHNMNKLWGKALVPLTSYSINCFLLCILNYFSSIGSFSHSFCLIIKSSLSQEFSITDAHTCCLPLYYRVHDIPSMSESITSSFEEVFVLNNMLLHVSQKRLNKIGYYSHMKICLKTGWPWLTHQLNIS